MKRREYNTNLSSWMEAMEHSRHRLLNNDEMKMFFFYFFSIVYFILFCILNFLLFLNIFFLIFPLCTRNNFVKFLSWSGRGSLVMLMLKWQEKVIMRDKDFESTWRKFIRLRSLLKIEEIDFDVLLRKFYIILWFLWIKYLNILWEIAKWRFFFIFL